MRTPGERADEIRARTRPEMFLFGRRSKCTWLWISAIIVSNGTLKIRLKKIPSQAREEKRLRYKIYPPKGSAKPKGKAAAGGPAGGQAAAAAGGGAAPAAGGGAEAPAEEAEPPAATAELELGEERLEGKSTETLLDLKRRRLVEAHQSMGRLLDKINRRTTEGSKGAPARAAQVEAAVSDAEELQETSPLPDGTAYGGANKSLPRPTTSPSAISKRNSLQYRNIARSAQLHKHRRLRRLLPVPTMFFSDDLTQMRPPLFRPGQRLLCGADFKKSFKTDFIDIIAIYPFENPNLPGVAPRPDDEPLRRPGALAAPLTYRVRLGSTPGAAEAPPKAVPTLKREDFLLKCALRGSITETEPPESGKFPPLKGGEHVGDGVGGVVGCIVC